MILFRRIFVFYNNINFYYKRQDQRMHKKFKQMAYIMGYIYFMHFEFDNIANSNWKHTYINADKVDHRLVDSLIANNFLLCQKDFQYQIKSIQHILSNILVANFFKLLFWQKDFGLDSRQQPWYQKFKALLQEI